MGLGLRLCLGEALILNPGTTAFDRWLNIFADPLAWLRASRNGIVVLRWEWAFEQLRDVTVLPSLKSCFARAVADLSALHEARAHAEASRHSGREDRDSA